jgi:hypothetical protein
MYIVHYTARTVCTYTERTVGSVVVDKRVQCPLIADNRVRSARTVELHKVETVEYNRCDQYNTVSAASADSRAQSLGTGM